MIALYPYKAQNDDELSFEKDDIISVVGRDEPEWWRGELNGLSGVFPSNYVGKFVTSGELIEDFLLKTPNQNFVFFYLQETFKKENCHLMMIDEGEVTRSVWLRVCVFVYG